MHEHKIVLSSDNRQHLATWLSDLVKSSSMLYGVGNDFLGFPEYLEPCEDGEVNDPYAWYTRNAVLTDEDYSDIANELVKLVVSRYGAGAVVYSMASKLDVLMDEERSARWLRPYVGAERTTLAYERGRALIRLHHYRLARAIMQEAADKGDAFCALYLIENKLRGEMFGCRDDEDERLCIGEEPIERTSVAYETALLLINGRVYDRAQEILRTLADNGDKKAAFYLMEQTINKRLEDEMAYTCFQRYTRNHKETECVPVTIDWTREKILSFLLDQYENGESKAAELLQDLLRLDVQSKLDAAKDQIPVPNRNTCIRAAIQSFKEYPENVVQSVINDYEQRHFSFRFPQIVPKTETSDPEDIPF